jgi:peptide/nickel transport system permease protein
VRQYLDWSGGLLRGDFGTSALNGETVTGQLGTKLGITAPLVLASTVLSVLVAVPLGIIAGARHRRADGISLSVVSQLGIAVPTFWAGLLLIIVFGVHWNVFPAQGFPRDGWDEPGRAVESLVLPTLTLALSQGAVLLRFVRSATLDVLHQDYIRTARAKGLTRTQALYRHGLRNASLPIISILGVQIASLIAGVVVIERVFNLPGVGQMLVRDIGSRDLEKVQGTVLLLAIIVLVVGFLVDVVHRLVDPRLRVGT